MLLDDFRIMIDWRIRIVITCSRFIPAVLADDREESKMSEQTVQQLKLKKEKKKNQQQQQITNNKKRNEKKKNPTPKWKVPCNENDK
jgi:hypothetical protein